NVGADARAPLPTVTAGGWHLGAVQALLEKHAPERTLFDEAPGFVTIGGERYQIADIGIRMLAPRELFRAQGFPDSYVIELARPDGKPLTKTEQIAMAGNSVCPPLAAAIVAANMRASCAREVLSA